MRPVVRKVLGIVLAALFLLGAWDLTAILVHSHALPGPGSAIEAFANEFTDILPHLVISAERVLAALTIGLLLAVPIGLLAGRIGWLDALVAPVIFLVYPIPKIVALPVLFVLLGTGTISKVALITLIVSFQIAVTTRDASRAVPAGAVVAVHSVGASPTQVFRHAVLPAALPGIFTALRLSMGHAIAALFFAESVAGSDGLGYYIIDAWAKIQYADMFAGVLAMAVLGVTLYEVADFAENRLCGWARVESRRSVERRAPREGIGR